MAPVQASRSEARRLPREQALVRAGTWKRFFSYASVLGFGLFIWLAAHHVTGVTSRTVPGQTPSTTGQNFFGGSGGYDFGSGSSGIGGGSGGYGPPITSTGAS